MNPVVKYITDVFGGFYSLGKGMYRTFHSLTHPKLILTQQYPENRETTLYIPERFKAELSLIKEGDVYKCTACTLCQTACPNGSIRITTQMTQVDGKNKKELLSYEYDLGKCTFCGQCVDACNFGALEFTNHFENSEYFKEKLVRTLNR